MATNNTSNLCSNWRYIVDVNGGSTYKAVQSASGDALELVCTTAGASTMWCVLSGV